MNKFTKDELEGILNCIECKISEYNDDAEKSGEKLANKIQAMIDNYKEDPWNTKKIAESHLKEAKSLILHAMCLLDMKNE